MKNILIVVNGFISYSGAEKVLIDYLNHQNTNNFYIVVFGNKIENYYFFAENYINNKVFYIECQYNFTKLSRFLTMYLSAHKITKNTLIKTKINRILDNINPDLIYFNNSLETCITFDIFHSYKRIIHIHDMIDTFKPCFKKRILYCLKNSDAVITVSKKCKDDMIKNNIQSKKIHVIHNFIDVNKVNYFSNNKINTKLVLGYVGAIIPRKGLDILYKAINLLGYKHLELLMVTNSIDEKYYSSFKDEINLTNVILYQNLNREQMQSVYRKMDFLVVPSRHDPLPTVVLEAMSNDVLVIGSNVDGIPEMVLNEKLLFNVNDYERLSLILRELISSNTSKIQRMKNQQLNNILTNFSFKNKDQLINEVINNV